MKKTIYHIETKEMPFLLSRNQLRKLGIVIAPPLFGGGYLSLTDPKEIIKKLEQKSKKPKGIGWVDLGDIKHWSIYARHRTGNTYDVKMCFNGVFYKRQKMNIFLTYNSKKNKFYENEQLEFMESIFTKRDENEIKKRIGRMK